jgi:hypothetical protein
MTDFGVDEAAVAKGEATVRPGAYVRHRQDHAHRNAERRQGMPHPYPCGVLLRIVGDEGIVRPHAQSRSQWSAPMVDIEIDTDRVDLADVIRVCLREAPTRVIPAGALKGRRTGLSPMADATASAPTRPPRRPGEWRFFAPDGVVVTHPSGRSR